MDKGITELTHASKYNPSSLSTEIAARIALGNGLNVDGNVQKDL